MMVLVDSSIWIGHFHSSDRVLVRLIDDGRVITHPFVVGEIASGGLRQRAKVLSLLEKLPGVFIADHDKVMAMVELQNLHGLGLGWIDMHLLASARLSAVHILTADRALGAAAGRLGVRF
ncbi:MAG: type II toxin-antitoxin system VapC family toxin [Phycisphaerales bacterium]|nr:type II toxin-antitoxin system VapC family toxin [Phycisphaerales bacterium]